MKINDGMYIGANPAAVRDGAKSFALNIMYNDDGNTLINENGFDNYQDGLENYGKLIGNIAVPKGVVLFYTSAAEENKDSIVYIVDADYSSEYKNIDDTRKNKILVLKGDFNFNIERPITGTFSYIKNNKIFITFTEGVNDEANETRILYLDDIENTLNVSNPDIKENIITYIIDDSKKLNLIPDIIYPTLDVNVINGGLKAGGYQIAISYKLKDDSYSDYSLLSPVYYATPTYGQNISAGEITDKGFSISLKHNDSIKHSFKNVKLAIIYKSATAIEAYETYDLEINSRPIYITSVTSLKSISLDDIIINNIAYIKDASETSFNGALLRGNVSVNNTNIVNKTLIQNSELLELIDVKTTKLIDSTATIHNITKVTDFINIPDISNKQFFKDNEIYYLYLILIDNKGKFLNAYPIPNIITNKQFFSIDYPDNRNVIEFDTFETNISKFINGIKTIYNNNESLAIKEINNIIADNNLKFNKIEYDVIEDYKDYIQNNPKKYIIKTLNNKGLTAQEIFNFAKTFINTIKGYSIYFAKSTTEISNWICQSLIIRDIGINDVIGDNYDKPFKSTSRYRIYPIEYLVTNTNLPNFNLVPLYHNEEAKWCFSNLEKNTGSHEDYTKKENGYDINIVTALADENGAKLIRDAFSHHIKWPQEGSGNRLGAYDRLNKYTKVDLEYDGSKVEMITPSDKKDSAVIGPYEEGDLIHSILDKENTKPSISISSYNGTASYFPINNSAVSNSGCDSCYKLFNENTKMENDIFGKSLKSEIKFNTIYLINTDTLEGWDEESQEIRYKVIITNQEYKPISNNSEKVILITTTTTKIYKSKEDYIADNEPLSTTSDSEEKEINNPNNGRVSYYIGAGNEHINWILNYNENSEYGYDSDDTVYNRAIVDLNKYSNINTISDIDLYSLDLIPATNIHFINYIDDNKPIKLKGDTFACLITQRCMCPAKQFHNTGDDTHHNNNIYHIHRMIITYYIKSRMNLLCLHSGKSINSHIVKFDSQYSDKADVQTIINMQSSHYYNDSLKRFKELFKLSDKYSEIIDLGYLDYTIDNFWHTDDGAAYETEMNWAGFNDITQSKDYDNFLTSFPSRIVRSNVNNMESNDIGWRKYKADNYKDIPITKGHIVNLLSDSKSIYIQMLFTLFVTTSKDSLGQGEEGTYIGSSDIFEREPTEIIFKQTGKIGCNNKFSSIINRYGYFVCDNEQGAIFHVKGENEVNELSDIGFKEWFKENISLNSINPYKYNGNFLILDEYNKRLIFTRIDKDIDTGIDNKSYTISYSLKTNLWDSFHSYIPVIGFENRKGLFYINIDNTIYKTEATNKCKFFDDKIYKSIAQFIFNEEPLISKAINHLEWRTQLIRNWKVNAETIQYLYNKSIDKLMIHTDTQCTGLLDTNVKKEWYNGGHLKYKAGRYIWHTIEDVIKNDKKEFLINPNNIPFKIDNFLNIKFKKKAWYELAKIHNPFAYITMVYNNTPIINGDKEEQVEFRLSNIDVVVTKDTRL